MSDADLDAVARAVFAGNRYMTLGTADEQRAAVGVAGVVRARGLRRALLGLLARRRATRATSRPGRR